MLPSETDTIVSFADEPLILVNEQDEEIGFLDKTSAHLDQGQLHRAFSIFIFNRQGQVLLQQRSLQKPLWPEYWANSCCSHPRRGEQTPTAAKRRLREELALDTPLEFIYKFVYQVPYHNSSGVVGSEYELCSVFVGYTDDAPVVNKNEVAAWRYVDPQWLDEQLATHGHLYTPWLHLEWTALRREFWSQLKR